MTRDDAGLRAVLRVRDAKEQESLLGFVHAIVEERRRAGIAAELRDVIGAVDQPTEHSGGAFLALQTALLATGDLLTAAERDTERAQAVTGQALSELTTARQRRRTAEMLIERREQRRADERQRLQDRESDELAQSAWLRRRAAEVSAS